MVLPRMDVKSGRFCRGQGLETGWLLVTVHTDTNAYHEGAYILEHYYFLMSTY